MHRYEPTMDTGKQLYETEATGWQRDLYDDIQTTFRAPIVNWIFRTLMANEPDFLRYAWGQLKPLYATRAFARFSTEYRDAVLSAVEESGDATGSTSSSGSIVSTGSNADSSIPTYRRETLGIAPAEFREFGGQLATFDVVGPPGSRCYSRCVIGRFTTIPSGPTPTGTTPRPRRSPRGSIATVAARRR